MLVMIMGRLLLWVKHFLGQRPVAATTLYLDYPSSWNDENCLVTLSSLHTIIINHQRSTNKLRYLFKCGRCGSSIEVFQDDYTSNKLTNDQSIQHHYKYLAKAFTKNNVALTHNWCTDLCTIFKPGYSK